MNNLEIVTDASIKTYQDKRTFGCAGALCINTGDTKFLISQDTTNNRSELLGVLLGIQLAHALVLDNPGYYDEIYLYSDSKLAIYGINQWMDGWIKSRDNNGVMYGTNKKPVKNQELFVAILTYLVDSGLKIKFRHCAGHVSPTSLKLHAANEVFYTSNGYYLRPEDIYKVSYYNNVIDNMTREKLQGLDTSIYPIQDYSCGYTQMCKLVFPMNYKEYIG